MVEKKPPDSPSNNTPIPAVDYSRAAFHAIQDVVLESYRKAPKGGQEAAGILYGTFEGNGVHVHAARRIACDHTRGRMFLLSVEDKVALKDQLTRGPSERALQGLAVVGWFLSQTAPIRTAMSASGRTMLSPTDLQIFGEFFPGAGKIVLVLRPHAAAVMQASVFLRQADESVQIDENNLEFAFKEPAAILDRFKQADQASPQPPDTAIPQRVFAAAASANTAAVSFPPSQMFTAKVSTNPPVEKPASVSPVARTPDPPATPTATPKSNEAAMPPISIPNVQSVAPVPLWDQPFKPAKRKSPTARVEKDTLKEPSAPPALARMRDSKGAKSTAPPSLGAYSKPTEQGMTTNFWKRPGGIAIEILIAILAIAPLGIRYYQSSSGPVPISLKIYERDRQLQVSWNHSSRAIQDAVLGSLEIVDGTQSRSVALSADDLARGNVTYKRKTGDVQIRFEVQNAGGQKSQEMAHFLAPQP